MVAQFPPGQEQSLNWVQDGPLGSQSRGPMHCQPELGLVVRRTPWVGVTREEADTVMERVSEGDTEREMVGVTVAVMPTGATTFDGKNTEGVEVYVTS